MASTLYNRRGTPVAYVRGSTFYLFSGEPVAYLHGKSIYAFSGKHLGHLISGWVCDNRGGCVLFTKGARGGPNRPETASDPPRAATLPTPVKVRREAKRDAPSEPAKWSRLSVERFFNR